MIDLQDRLVNGQLGVIKHIVADSKGNVKKVYVKFDDPKAGMNKINSETFEKQHLWVPLEKKS